MLLSGGLVVWLGSRGVGTFPLAGFLDAILGVALLAGMDSVRPWSLFRAWGGLVLFGLMGLVTRNWLELAIQVPFTVGLILLLQKKPRARLAPWATGVPALVLVILAIVTASGTRHLTELQRQSSPIETRLRGQRLPYSVEVPRSGWRLLQQEAADAFRKGTDRWLVNPARGAHLYVEGFRLEERNVSLEKLEALRTQELGDDTSSLEVLPTPGFPPRTGRSRLLHYRRRIQGQQFEFLHALIARGPAAYEIKAWEPLGTLDGSGIDELRSIILSFQFEEG